MRVEVEEDEEDKRCNHNMYELYKPLRHNAPSKHHVNKEWHKNSDCCYSV